MIEIDESVIAAKWRESCKPTLTSLRYTGNLRLVWSGVLPQKNAYFEGRKLVFCEM